MLYQWMGRRRWFITNGTRTNGSNPIGEISLLTRRDAIMNVTLSIGPLLSLIAGILILIVPRLLNYIVALYLIIIGLVGLFGAGSWRL
jgi:Protein of unknown function (DUF3096)